MEQKLELTIGNKTHHSTSSPHRLTDASHIAASRLAKHLPAKQSICQLKHISAPGSPMPLFLKLCREQNGDVGKS